MTHDEWLEKAMELAATCESEYGILKCLDNGVFKESRIDEARAALRAHLAAHPPEGFDAWRQNPYTKVLEKSIDEDYVPRLDKP